MRAMKADALALEYQRYYGTARGNLKVSDLVNNPAANSECRVFSLGLPEEFWDERLLNFGSLFQDRADPGMVAEDVVQHLPHVLFL